jgi:type IX secretion system PorP/SprF family membrane protein
MKRICLSIFVIFTVFCSAILTAQDIHFSQYLQAPLLINPALTGVFEGSHRAILNYRSQGKAMGAPYTTMAFSYDTHIKKDRLRKNSYLGLGLYAFQDVAGDSKLTQSQVAAALSGVIKLDEANSLSLGLKGAYVKSSVTLDNLRWGNQFDGTGYNGALSSQETRGMQSFGLFDVSTGIVWQYRKDAKTFRNGNEFSKFDLGVSYNHVNRPSQKFLGFSEKLNAKIIVHSSTEFDLKDSKYAIIANAYYVKQGKLKEIVLGASVKYFFSKKVAKYTGYGSHSALVIGSSFRFKDAIIPTLMYEREDFTIGMSYDFKISSLSSISRSGGYEIVLRYTMGNTKM